MPHRKIISPFKFLDSYQKNDIQSYFGREKESLALYELYKDSSIMILHGPSGSGKTSLIYCGLLNKIQQNKQVISIRREDHIIESIKKKLFTNLLVEGAMTTVTPAELLDDFLSAHADLNRILGFIEHIEDLMLVVEEEIIEHKRNIKKIVTTQPEFLDTEAKDDEYNISKYKERLQKFILERKELLEKLREKSNHVSTISEQLKDYLTNSSNNNASVAYAPLIIFDQFEEIFVHGTQEEVNQFGLFLKLIDDHKIPCNIIISLREEYFGYLDQLQSFVPHIFYKKIRLAHPNKEGIKNIIEKSFQKFNINQFVDNTNDEIPEKGKQDRIELILDQIKIKDNGSTSYHLPFLQVYLDRLYKIDYYRTYGDALVNLEKDSLLPLEFKEHEIKEFGSIENVLENYIREINSKIIRNTENKLNNKVQHKDSVIKFLRHFKTIDNLKKRIPLKISGEDYYLINSKSILTKIQRDIWGDINLEYNETVSEIVTELKEKGILNVSTDYAELSHDIIAKVISNIRTEDDFRPLIKKDFISSFDIYQDTQDEGDLLTSQQIQRLNQCLDYVLNDEDPERLEQKKEFFNKSVEKNKKDIRYQIRQERKIKRYTFYLMIIGGLITLSLILTIQLFKTNLEKDIKHLLTEAMQVLSEDRTSAMNYIKKAEQIHEAKLWNIFKLFSKEDEFISSMKTKLYDDYNQTPFYQTSLILSNSEKGGNNYINKTKTRRFSENSDSLYIYATTGNDQLKVWKINFKKRNEKGILINFKENNNVLHFEPFPSLTKLTSPDILLIKKTPDNTNLIGLYNINGELLRNYEQIKINDTITDVEHLYKSTFLIGHGKNLDEITFQKDQPTLVKRIKTFDKDIEKIKKLKNDDGFLVLYGNKSMYLKRKNEVKDDILKHVFKHTKKGKKIVSFNIKNGDTLLLGLSEEILAYDLKTSEFYRYMVHDKDISTIDFDTKNNMLIGNRENGANLWSKENVLLKQFIGHQKPIFNVSFIKGAPNFVVTSSCDQTLKIWNTTSISKHKNKNELEEKILSRVMTLPKTLNSEHYKSKIPKYLYSMLYYKNKALMK